MIIPLVHESYTASADKLGMRQRGGKNMVTGEMSYSEAKSKNI